MLEVVEHTETSRETFPCLKRQLEQLLKVFLTKGIQLLANEHHRLFAYALTELQSQTLVNNLEQELQSHLVIRLVHVFKECLEQWNLVGHIYLIDQFKHEVPDS